jgi:hypothetical protein
MEKSASGSLFFEFHPYSVRKKIEKKCFRNDTLGCFAGKILEIFGFVSILDWFGSHLKFGSTLDGLDWMRCLDCIACLDCIGSLCRHD